MLKDNPGYLVDEVVNLILKNVAKKKAISSMHQDGATILDSSYSAMSTPNPISNSQGFQPIEQNNNGVFRF